MDLQVPRTPAAFAQARSFDWRRGRCAAIRQLHQAEILPTGAIGGLTDVREFQPRKQSKGYIRPVPRPLRDKVPIKSQDRPALGEENVRPSCSSLHRGLARIA